MDPKVFTIGNDNNKINTTYSSASTSYSMDIIDSSQKYNYFVINNITRDTPYEKYILDGLKVFRYKENANYNFYTIEKSFGEGGLLFAIDNTNIKQEIKELKKRLKLYVKPLDTPKELAEELTKGLYEQLGTTNIYNYNSISKEQIEKMLDEVFNMK